MSRTTTCVCILSLVTLLGCAEEKASLLPDGGPRTPTAVADAGARSPTGGTGVDGGIDGGRRDSGRDPDDEDEDVSDEADDQGTDDADDEDVGRGDAGARAITPLVPAVEDGVLAAEHRCNEDARDGISPEVSWTPGPPGTKSYAVTLRVKDMPNPIGTVNPNNWTIFDIPADVTSLPSDIPRGAEITDPIPARQARSSQRLSPASYGYYGPCTLESRYELTVYALDVETLPDVPPEPNAADVEAAIEEHAIPNAVGSVSFSSAP